VLGFLLLLSNIRRHRRDQKQEQRWWKR